MMSYVNEKYKYSELTPQIIGCAIEVHKILGNDFQEAIHQRALALELQLRGIHYQREVEIDVLYKEKQVSKTDLEI